MPQPHQHAKPAPLPTAGIAPKFFAAWVMAAYLLSCLPLLALRHFDPSVFVVAGDRYVNAALADPKIRVKANSDGYDGQFYYRQAVHPFSIATQAGGITFDHPAKRMTRIMYPLLAWLASFGQPAAAGWAMLAVNILGLGAIAWFAADLAWLLPLPRSVPFLIVLWPGFAVALLHDTTEIVASAFVLAALAAWFRRNLAAFAVLASCAVLARETTLTVWAGLAIYALVAEPWRRGQSPTASRMLACALPLATFLVWREVLWLRLGESPQANGVAQDLTWPFAGAASMLWQCLTGARKWASTPLKDMLERGYVLLTAIPLIAFLFYAAKRCVSGKAGALAWAWAGTALLMSLLTNAGPWVDPAAYLRAFTECYLVGVLVIGASLTVWSERWVTAFCGVQAGLAWVFCMIQLR